MALAAMICWSLSFAAASCAESRGGLVSGWFCRIKVRYARRICSWLALGVTPKMAYGSLR